jgi:ribosomal protein L11 methyltransferase
MKTRALWRVSVTTLPEADEAVAELLQNDFGQPAVCDHHLESGVTLVSVYLEEKPDWNAARQRSLAAGLARIRECALNVGAGTVQLERVRREDWAESWKKHFPPMEIGTRLLIRPSWSRRRARKGQAVVVLDPGLSFGTGQHPTTGFCLKELVTKRKAAEAQSFLDIGTGSGILAIAAAKLGYRPVVGFDFDPEAVRIARLNARRNRVADRIQFFDRDVTKLPRRSAEQYSVVCANLIANLLLQERDRILARVAPNGLLVVAGILDVEFLKVRSAYEAAGCRLVADRAEREWHSGSFVWSE